jgi:hypothetical protein
VLTRPLEAADTLGFPAAKAPAPGERRRAQRIRTVFRIARVARDRAIGLWRVRNISDFGMMLLNGARLPRGAPLSIALSDTVALDAKVVWSTREGCGVAFEQPIDSAALLTSLVAEQRGPRHRPPRLPARIRAAAYGESGVHAIRITDVSQHGFGFSHDGAIGSGARLRVVFESGLERRGIVRWSAAGSAGLQLLDPFTCGELESMSAA